MGVSRNRGKPPEMDGLFHGKAYEQMDDLEIPLFLETPYIPFKIKTTANSCMLKNDSKWSMNPYFQGRFAVSFREGIGQLFFSARGKKKTTSIPLWWQLPNLKTGIASCLLLVSTGSHGDCSCHHTPLEQNRAPHGCATPPRNRHQAYIFTGWGSQTVGIPWKKHLKVQYPPWN